MRFFARVSGSAFVALALVISTVHGANAEAGSGVHGSGSMVEYGQEQSLAEMLGVASLLQGVSITF